MVGLTDCGCGGRHHPNSECSKQGKRCSDFSEVAAIFLRSAPETINKSLEAAESDIRFKDKVGNTLYFRAGEKEFWVTEQELLASNKSVLDVLQERAER